MSQERLDIIRPYLDRFKRRFTVLDLGSNDGFLSKAIAREFNAVVVAVEMNQEQFQNSYDGYSRIICLHHKMTGSDLRLFGECEHFDIVLALNFLHWFEDDWEKAASAVLNMGDHVFAQFPRDGDSRAPGYNIVPNMRKMIEHRNHVLIGETVQFPRHEPRPLWLVTNTEKYLIRATVESPECVPSRVFSDLDLKKISKHGAEPTPWIEGINLWNFCMLGGVWPTKEKVLDLLNNVHLPEENHGDIVPHNFILDGEALHLIDGHEGWPCPDKDGLAETIRKVETIL